MGVVEVFPEGAMTPKNTSHIGVHFWIDCYGVPEEHLCNSDLLAAMLMEIAREANLTPLSDPHLYRFPNDSLTGFLPLAESHIAFHTYPERAFLAADFFTCGEENRARQAIREIVRILGGTRTIIRSVQRGQEEIR